MIGPVEPRVVLTLGRFSDGFAKLGKGPLGQASRAEAVDLLRNRPCMYVPIPTRTHLFVSSYMEPYIEFMGTLQNNGFWLVKVCNMRACADTHVFRVVIICYTSVT